MKNMTLEAIAKACGGTYTGEEAKKTGNIKGAVTDSRQVEKGFLFIPVKGERVDGHDFIPSVFEKGAAATLTERPLEHCSHPYILVDSCLQALKDIARYYRSQLAIPVVGITGSVGKTSTKEMIASVLSQRYRVLKTAGNFNNEIGLPLTILRIRGEHEAAVVEMGISDFGEMHRLAEIARPDVCVITNIGICHLENLKTRDGILKAKTEVFDHMKKGAAVILNGDDDKLITIDEAGGSQPIYYGLSERTQNGKLNAVYGDGIEDLGLKGCRGLLHTPKGTIMAEIPIPGQHNIYNAMAAAGVGLALGLTLEEVQKGIASVETIGGRSNLIELDKITVIDDCYNANPVSVKASLDVLKNGLGRTIAVLGDMAELGENEKQLHYEVGAYASKQGIAALFCTGPLSHETARGAGESDGRMEVFHFDSREELLANLLEYLKDGDTVLVKASHSMEFPKVVEAICQARPLKSGLGQR